MILPSQGKGLSQLCFDTTRYGEIWSNAHNAFNNTFGFELEVLQQSTAWDYLSLDTILNLKKKKLK